jgi:hypothetical protein
MLKKIHRQKKNEFFRLFQICCTVQNVAKGNKIAKTGLKNVFLFIKTGFSFVLNGTIERVQNAFQLWIRQFNVRNHSQLFY